MRSWILYLYFIRLNVYNEQIIHKFNLNPNDALKMTSQLREGIVDRKEVTLTGQVECNEVAVVAGLRRCFKTLNC
jgi:hypothetical protein